MSLKLKFEYYIVTRFVPVRAMGDKNIKYIHTSVDLKIKRTHQVPNKSIIWSFCQPSSP
jgi:hypothetical protein